MYDKSSQLGTIKAGPGWAGCGRFLATCEEGTARSARDRNRSTLQHVDSRALQDIKKGKRAKMLSPSSKWEKVFAFEANHVG